MKRRLKISGKQKKILWSVFAAQLLISHVLLPISNRNNFLLFSDWDLFSFHYQNKFQELTWDDGKTYFRRDHSRKMKRSGIYTVGLTDALVHNNLDSIRKYYLEAIRSYCSCNKIKFVILEGQLYQHIFKHKTLPIVKEEML